MDFVMLRRDVFVSIIFASFLLSSCASSTPAAVPTETVTAYATPAAQPWLNELFACANERSVLVNVTADAPDISLRIGEPADLTLPAFQIDEEEIFIATNRTSPVQNLTREEVQAWFLEGDELVQVWVYGSGVDVQRVFEQAAMEGRSVTSFARVAASPQEISDLLNSETLALGILPAHWVAGDIREVYSLGSFPVLAVTRMEPAGGVEALLACLQRD